MSVPRSIDRPSPNHDSRAVGTSIEILLLHYTGMTSCAEALERLVDPAAKVSAHYLIDDDGTCYRLVPEVRRAWHAGESTWGGAPDVNSRSVGIEPVNPGQEHGYRAFPDAQIACLAGLATDILSRHPIPPERVLGHSDVAPLRKEDPGELFPWQHLAHAGIGLWPNVDLAVSANAPRLAPGASGPAVTQLQSALAAYGYGIEDTGHYDPLTAAVVRAFQRHFRPSRVDGVADPETQSLLHHLLDRLVRA